MSGNLPQMPDSLGVATWSDTGTSWPKQAATPRILLEDSENCALYGTHDNSELVITHQVGLEVRFSDGATFFSPSSRRTAAPYSRSIESSDGWPGLEAGLDIAFGDFIDNPVKKLDAMIETILFIDHVMEKHSSAVRLFDEASRHRSIPPISNPNQPWDVKRVGTVKRIGTTISPNTSGPYVGGGWGGSGPVYGGGGYTTNSSGPPPSQYQQAAENLISYRSSLIEES